MNTLIPCFLVMLAINYTTRNITVAHAVYYIKRIETHRPYIFLSVTRHGEDDGDNRSISTTLYIVPVPPKQFINQFNQLAHVKKIIITSLLFILYIIYTLRISYFELKSLVVFSVSMLAVRSFFSECNNYDF